MELSPRRLTRPIVAPIARFAAPVARVGAAAQNALEVARFGGLTSDEEPSPYEVVSEQRVYRLRRYYPTNNERSAPPMLLVPPMMLAAEVYDVSSTTSAVTIRSGWSARVKTLVAIVGPGLIVMVGDNDAGAFGTYTQAGQNYGTRLLWTLLLLVPVLYVNQEMVVRLGAVTGVGHARLILERFGRFWGAFSVIDLFLLNALTIVTEFIGISLGLSYLGLPKVAGVLVSAVVVIAAASTGSFRRFEQVCLVLVAGSLLLVPILVMAHPPVSRVAHDFVVPGMPAGAQLSTVMLLIIAIVGTTVAPWQLFFQQSYIIDKRITPRFIGYEKVDLWIGIVIVGLGAGAMMAFSTTVFAGHPEFGQFTDAGGIADGLGRYVNQAAGVLFALALIDASIIGAAAVSLATAYAIGDVLGLRHSLHRSPKEAKGFYVVFAGLLVAAAIGTVRRRARGSAYATFCQARRCPNSAWS